MNPLFELCFPGDADGFVELAIGGVTTDKRHWVKAGSDPTLPQGVECYFGPALRKVSGLMGKANVRCSWVCWADIDRGGLQLSALPPSAIVNSGHGYHLYWRMNRPLAELTSIERLNEAMAQSVGADACQNADRIMRIPGTPNMKVPDAIVNCVLVGAYPKHVYDPKSLYKSTKIPEKTVKYIVTGNVHDFTSRSERDWYIITHLVAVGLTDEDITTVFTYHSCGDKFREDGLKYIEHTIERVRATQEIVADSPRSGIVEDVKGMYIRDRKGERRLSTFVLKPTKLLEMDSGDAIMCDVTCDGSDHVWKSRVIPVTAFANSRALIDYLEKFAWVWFGKDADVKTLQMHLIGRLQSIGLPRAVGVTVIGRHELGVRTFFVTGDLTVCSDGTTWNAADAPIVYVDSGREHPPLAIRVLDENAPLFERIVESLLRINEPEVIWPMLGWFMATPLKTMLEKYGYRFPVLNVFGTRGSGKTTTLLRVFQPIIGYCEERTYDSNTTRFVILALLGSSNTTPIAFSEFRVAAATDFTRFILLSYDTGRDPRGRADQTTVDYPLLAPFSIDGEDMLEDPAALERIIAVRMRPETIAEGTAASAEFESLQSLDLDVMAGPYILHTLRLDVPSMLDIADDDVWSAFPEALPNRIRKNLVVAWFGVRSFASFMAGYGVDILPDDGARVLSGALDNVYSTRLGRAATSADEFAEFVVNCAARKTTAFPWLLDKGVLWFQLTPAFEYFVSQRARQHKTTLSRRAIRDQLVELSTEFTTAPRIVVIKNQKVLAYGVDLHKAYESGLDIPEEFSQGTIILEV